MRKARYQLPGLFARLMAAFLLCAFIASSFAATAHAQSGRRPPKRTAPPPAPPPPEQETGAHSTDDGKSRTPVAVIKSTRDVFTSSFLAQVPQRGCADRLKESSALSVTIARDMNRKQASDFAKKSQDTYVVWLEVDTDRVGMRNSRGDYDIILEYVVFAPVTGKIKTSGRIFASDYAGVGVGGVGIPLPGSRSSAAIEYALKHAGREAANRAFAAFEVGKPD